MSTAQKEWDSELDEYESGSAFGEYESDSELDEYESGSAFGEYESDSDLDESTLEENRQQIWVHVTVKSRSRLE